MNLIRYPKYKNSGIEWIGDIPDSWNVDRIKASIKSCNNGIWGDEPSGDSVNTICVRVADFNRDNLSVDISEPTLRLITEKERSSRLLKKGDLLIEKSGGGENQPVGCVVLYNHDEPAVCSNFIAKMSLKAGMHPSFWKYVHAAAYSIRLTVGSINQTSGIQNLDQDRYFNEKVAFPGLDEQKKIADFLDRETAKIDKLIQKQEKLIEFLEEKKHISILEVMSSGLNKATVYNESTAIFWAKKIPKHWEQFRAKFIFEIKKRISGELGYKVLSITQRGIKVKDTESNEGQLSMDYSKYQIVEPGDFAMNHMDLLTGYVDISSDLGVTSPDYRVFSIRDEKRFFPKFYLLILQLCYKSKLFYPFGQGAAQLGRWRLPTDAFNNFIFPVPPIAEQMEICQVISGKNKKYDSLINRAEIGVQLLKEHRASLISNAVTGKIDVREEK